jgi:hypothetical protein
MPSGTWARSARSALPREPEASRNSHAPAHAAGNDAPLIGERAATRGRMATEGGDERAGVKRRHQFSLHFFHQERARLRRRPLIGEPAAKRGRSATESGDERAGVKMAVIRSRSCFAHGCAHHRSTLQRPRRATRPGTRTRVSILIRRRRPPRRVVPQRTRRNAGAARRNVAMRPPV